MFTDAQLRTAAHDAVFMEQLLSLVSERRRALFEKALAGRTRHLCAVIENVEDGHNTSAVIRSCECLGIQDVHVISEEGFRASRKILIGAGKWVDIHKYPGSGEGHAEHCVENLRSRGYRIVVTLPRPGATPVQELRVDRPLAICFGHERTGISQKLQSLADEAVTIPMYGFSESFNISVAAAIIFHTLTRKLHEGDVPWQLPDAEKKLLRLQWALRSVKRPGMLMRSFLNGRVLGNP